MPLRTFTVFRNGYAEKVCISFKTLLEEYDLTEMEMDSIIRLRLGEQTHLVEPEVVITITRMS